MIIIKVEARMYENDDDCLTKAARDAQAALEMAYTPHAKWLGGEEGERDFILVYVPPAYADEVRAWRCMQLAEVVEEAL